MEPVLFADFQAEVRMKIAKAKTWIAEIAKLIDDSRLALDESCQLIATADALLTSVSTPNEATDQTQPEVHEPGPSLASAAE